MIWSVYQRANTRRMLGIVNEPTITAALCEAWKIWGSQWDEIGRRFVERNLIVRPGETQG